MLEELTVLIEKLGNLAYVYIIVGGVLTLVFFGLFVWFFTKAWKSMDDDFRRF